MPKAVVIGAGFGGMASALRLRAKGYDVTLLDKQAQLGGRGTQYKTAAGFVHDAGPTVITAKFLFDELFALFGKRREDYFELVDLYPWYRIRFADGSCFNYGGTLEQMEGELEKVEPGATRNFHRYLEHSKKIFDVGFTELGCAPFHEPWKMLSCVPDLVRLESYKTVWGLAAKYFKTEKLRRVFSFQPLLVGGNPFNTTSIYSLIFYLERQWGVQFAMGGTGAIVRALEKLMREEGVEIRLDCEVKRIEVTRVLSFDGDGPRGNNWKEVNGIVLEDRSIPLDASPVDQSAGDVVIANADAPHVWQHLISKEFHTLKSKVWMPRLKYSMGLFVLYFGTTRKYENVAHHTIVLGEWYKELITDIFDKHRLETKDLSVYLHRPTATDPSFAPEGCDSFYVLVPVPNLQGASGETPHVHAGLSSAPDWSVLGPMMQEATIDYLARTELPGLREVITEPFYVTPEHFRDKLNSVHGAGFSIQPLFSQSAYFRFHNKAPGIEGLYLVGAGTHPGAGIPGVLCSAKLVDSLIPSVR